MTGLGQQQPASSLSPGRLESAKSRRSELLLNGSSAANLSPEAAVTDAKEWRARFSRGAQSYQATASSA